MRVRGGPVVFSAFVSTFLALDAQAEWVVDGEARLSSDYDTNVRLSSDDEDDAFANRASGQIEVRQVTERSEVSVIGGAIFLNYAEAEDLDDKDIEYLDIRSSWEGERSVSGINGNVRRDVMLRTIGFIRDPLEAPDVEEGTEPGSEIDEGLEGIPDGGDVDAGSTEEQIRRVRTRVKPFFDYELTERTSVQLDYTFDGLQYDGGEEVNLQDSQRHTVGLGLKRQLSELNSIRMNVRAGRFEPDVNPETDSVETTVGFERRLTERWGGSIDVGASYSEQEDTDNTGFVFRLRGYRRGEIGQLYGMVERALYPTGFGDLSETDRLMLGMTGALSETVDWRIGGDAFQTDSDTGEGRDYLSVGPEVSWRLTETFAIGANYRYTWTDREQEGSASGSTVGLFLSYRPEREI